MATLKSDLTAIAGKVGSAAQKALLQTGTDVFEISQQFVPVLTGELKQSGGVLPISSSEIHVGYGAEHSVWVEHGTSKMSAQPFLTPSFHEGEAIFRHRLKEEMEKLG